ncbi:hypothetical protein BC832DRAFT_612395 [Gaertneriomyces semiglobifer]|nr:hypothetical protein BC832DRAFT_612395 [Gaertneriomyces semiglobifer]
MSTQVIPLLPHPSPASNSSPTTRAPHLRLWESGKSFRPDQASHRQCWESRRRWSLPVLFQTPAGADGMDLTIAPFSGYYVAGRDCCDAAHDDTLDAISWFATVILGLALGLYLRMLATPRRCLFHQSKDNFRVYPKVSYQAVTGQSVPPKHLPRLRRTAEYKEQHNKRRSKEAIKSNLAKAFKIYNSDH